MPRQPFRILYEDRHLLLVVKPPGIDVHGQRADDPASLVSKVASQIGVEARKLHPASRLDRPVSGILPLARSKIAKRSLTQQYQGRKVHRTYVALGSGPLDPSEGRWDRPVDAVQQLSRGRRPETKETKPAVTDYRVLQDLAESCTLVELQPRTGRTHQLRIHMSLLGRCPIVGDRRYGGPRSLCLPNGAVLDAPRIMLHAFRIDLRHPESGERMVVEAPLWPDMAELLTKLGGTPMLAT